jgi:VanZ family protein
MFHFGAYAILGCLLMWSIGISEASLKMKSYLPRMAIAWLIALLIGGAIEIVQPYFGRGLEVLDFICDALGAACGAAFGVISLRWADRFDQKRSSE